MFESVDGAQPEAGVILDKAGNLYGTTNGGGPDNTGTVFKVAPGGNETMLYAFTGGKDGGYPLARLVEHQGELFGTTSNGGVAGDGVIFKVASDGTEKVRHSFMGGSDGKNPFYSGLIHDKAGNFYGTTEEGGSAGAGTIFKFAPGQGETVLYSFKSGNDGGYPVATLFLDKAGNLYGTTNGGGAGDFGTVFKLAPNGTETVLYSFQGGSDGAYPLSSLFEDASGNLYGTTGGGDVGNDFGTVFKLAPNGTETVLYAFTGGSDGSQPQGGLIANSTDQKGALFGTTAYGGANGYGTVFSVKKQRLMTGSFHDAISLGKLPVPA